MKRARFQKLADGGIVVSAECELDINKGAHYGILIVPDDFSELIRLMTEKESK